MVRYGDVWFGAVRYGTVRYDTIYILQYIYIETSRITVAVIKNRSSGTYNLSPANRIMV